MLGCRWPRRHWQRSAPLLTSPRSGYAPCLCVYVGVRAWPCLLGVPKKHSDNRGDLCVLSACVQYKSLVAMMKELVEMSEAVESGGVAAARDSLLGSASYAESGTIGLGEEEEEYDSEEGTQ